MQISSIVQPAAEAPQSAPVRTVGATAAVGAVSAAAQKPAQADPKALQEAVDAANEAVSAIKCELDFSIDEGTGKTVVRVVEKQTGTVIRQMPTPEMLEIAKALDRLQGLLVHNKA